MIFILVDIIIVVVSLGLESAYARCRSFNSSLISPPSDALLAVEPDCTLQRPVDVGRATSALGVCSVVISFIFVAELILRVVALGGEFFRSPLNIFDSIIVVGTAGVVVGMDGVRGPAVIAFARIFRWLRIVKTLGVGLRKEAELRESITVAERLSRLDFAAVEPLAAVQNPSRTERAFLLIARRMREYSAFMPQAMAAFALSDDDPAPSPRLAAFATAQSLSSSGGAAAAAAGADAAHPSADNVSEVESADSGGAGGSGGVGISVGVAPASAARPVATRRRSTSVTSGSRGAGASGGGGSTGGSAAQLPPPPGEHHDVDAHLAVAERVLAAARDGGGGRALRASACYVALQPRGGAVPTDAQVDEALSRLTTAVEPHAPVVEVGLAGDAVTLFHVGRAATSGAAPLLTALAAHAALPGATVAVASGPVVAGAVGAGRVRRYAVRGSVPPRAALLAQLAAACGVPVVCDAATAAAAPAGLVSVRVLDRVVLPPHCAADAAKGAVPAFVFTVAAPHQGSEDDVPDLDAGGEGGGDDDVAWNGLWARVVAGEDVQAAVADYARTHPSVDTRMLAAAAGSGKGAAYGRHLGLPSPPPPPPAVVRAPAVTSAASLVSGVGSGEGVLVITPTAPAADAAAAAAAPRSDEGRAGRDEDAPAPPAGGGEGGGGGGGAAARGRLHPGHSIFRAPSSLATSMVSAAASHHTALGGP